MANHARIENGIVAEIIDDGGKDIAKMFHASIVSTLVPEKAGMVVGGTWDGVVFGSIPEPNMPAVPTISERRDKINRVVSPEMMMILEAIEDELNLPKGKLIANAKMKVI